MKPLLPIASMLLLSSCFTYQHATVSADRTSKNELKEIVWENDTLRISFNFNGKWGKFTMSTMNKTNEPITINWAKSAITYNGQPVNLFDGSLVITSDINRNQFYERQAFPMNEQPVATVRTSVNVPMQTDFLPPKTFITRQNIDVSRIIPQVSKISAEIKQEKISDEGMKIKYRQASFTEATSPLKFELFFTFNIGNNDKAFNTRHLFYVSEVKQTDDAGPFEALVSVDGDKFYVRVQE